MGFNGKKLIRSGKKRLTKAKTSADGKKITPAKKAVPAKKSKKSVLLAKQKALKAKTSALRGVHFVKGRKVWYRAVFKRPKTLMLKRKPKYPRKSVPTMAKMDQYKIIKYPLTTESAMKKIEDNNTLVFLVDLKATKPMIKSAVKKLYDIEAARINVLIRPDGYKKAYVRLASDYDALDVASKIGII